MTDNHRGFSTRHATAAEREAWLDGWCARWEAEHARTRTEPHTDIRRKRYTESPDAIVLRLLDAGQAVGFLALSIVMDYGTPSAVLDDVCVDEAYRRRGIGTAAVRLAEDWARPRARRIRSRTSLDPAQRALMRTWALGGQSMVKDLTGGDLALPPGAAVRPMTQPEYVGWRPHLVEGYGQSFVDAGVLTIEEARVRAEEQTSELLPDGIATEGHEFLMLVHEGERAGVIWLRHGMEPGMSFVFDVEVHEDRRGKGFGRALMVAGEAATLAAGNRRLGLYVFGHNTVAMRLYEKLGYQVIDQNWSLTLS